MNHGFSLGDFVEAGSGVLLLFTGIAMLVLVRERGEVRLLGLAIAMWGLSHVTHYLAGPAGFWTSTVASGALLGLAIIATWRYPNRPSRAAAWGLAALLALCLGWLAWAWWANLRAGRFHDLVWGIGNPPLGIALSLAALAFIPSAWALRGLLDPSNAPRLARLTLVFALYGAYNAASVTAWLIARDGNAAPVVYYLLTLSLLPIPIWLVAGATGGPARVARWTSHAIAAVALLGAAATVFLDWEATFEFGIPGAFRTVGWGILVMTILRHGLLARPLPRLVVTRGTTATAALAALFIVAQIAQEFFAAEYGLLMGGVVAGTLVFAVQPVQRAMERMADRQKSGSYSDAEREDAYRQAVRLALRDRKLSREEERQLLRLAFHLGVSTPRAMEIQDELERAAS